jgi:hypothetical protein
MPNKLKFSKPVHHKISLKINSLDTLFSKFIRNRDKNTCVRCHRIFKLGERGLTNSHFYGRGMKSVRYEEDNCDSLCYPGCHLYWQNQNREEYREFKIRQLGQKRFDLLTLQANSTAKPDYKLLTIYYSKVLKGNSGIYPR